MFCPDEYVLDQFLYDNDVKCISNFSEHSLECLFRFIKSRKRSEVVKDKIGMELMIQYTSVNIQIRDISNVD